MPPPPAAAAAAGAPPPTLATPELCLLQCADVLHDAGFVHRDIKASARRAPRRRSLTAATAQADNVLIRSLDAPGYVKG